MSIAQNLVCLSVYVLGYANYQNNVSVASESAEIIRKENLRLASVRFAGYHLI